MYICEQRFIGVWWWWWPDNVWESWRGGVPLENEPCNLHIQDILFDFKWKTMKWRREKKQTNTALNNVSHWRIRCRWISILIWIFIKYLAAATMGVLQWPGPVQPINFYKRWTWFLQIVLRNYIVRLICMVCYDHWAADLLVVVCYWNGFLIRRIGSFGLWWWSKREQFAWSSWRWQFGFLNGLINEMTHFWIGFEEVRSYNRMDFHRLGKR